MSETTERSAAEMRSLLRFAQGLGLDEATVREIYEAVGQEAAAADVGDDDRMAEVRKRMLVAARTCELGACAGGIDQATIEARFNQKAMSANDRDQPIGRGQPHARWGK